MALDLITIGRASVDLYGAQIGGRLEDMTSFNKYIGGSPTNIAAGTARLGLKSALITRVGDEAMGRFIREQLMAEGVDVRGVKTDPERLSALVLLGIRDETQFPLIFYRENCADMALSPDDIDPNFIGEARALVATGTHLSNPQVEAATLTALNIARDKGKLTALDIDYRPNLWGLAGHDAGESRFIESQAVTQKLQANLPLFDLIVGTEEEFHIAGGTIDTIKALQNVRDMTKAVLVCKRGSLGAVAFTDALSGWEDGVTGTGFKVEIFNVLGAGDGFMSGLLKGWLDGEDWQQSLIYANACGALAVSRHGCTPAYPSWQELCYFLKQGITRADLRHDKALEQIHWSTNRKADWPHMRIFAFDHRKFFEDMQGANREKISAFKLLCLQAVQQVADACPDDGGGYGVLCDERLGKTALHAASGSRLWIGRPVEWPESRPLQLEPELGLDFGGLGAWASDNVVKVLCFAHPDDDKAMQTAQEETLLRLFTAARRNHLEFLLELIPSKIAQVNDETTAKLIKRFYEIGIYPDWWKLEPMISNAAWQATIKAIEQYDSYTRGILVLGLDKAVEDLRTSFEIATKYSLVKGFAVGRTIFADVARAWMQGRLNDKQAVEQMAQDYQRLCDIWDDASKANQTGEKA